MDDETGAGRGTCIKMVAGKLERKRLFLILRCKWEDNIKMYLKEIGVRMWIGFI
jgi:hypothetical protein